MFRKCTTFLAVLFIFFSSQPQNILAVEGSRVFKEGHKDGCSTGKFVAGVENSSWKKNNKLFFSDEDYKKGWEDGFFECLGDLKETEKTRKAVSLAILNNKLANAELTAYFSMPDHKAFALNPLNRGNYYWVKKESSKDKAIKIILKRGYQCILFAADNEIVWEKELRSWEQKYLDENLSKKIDEGGNTVFHYLGCYENLPYLERAIKNLISGGEIGILTTKNKKRQTAEDMARLYGNKETVKLLKNAVQQ